MDTRTKARALSALTVGGVAATVIATGVIGGSDPIGGGLEKAGAAALEPFSSCDELLEYADDHRWARSDYPYMAGEPVMSEATAAGSTVLEDSALSAAAPRSGAVGPGETGTNTQEAGIDEPDIAKLSGTTLFRVRGNTVSAYDVSGDSAVLLDELSLEGRAGESRLLIAGDRAIVSSFGFGGARDVPTTSITELDVSEPSAMSAVRRLDVEGTEVSARLQGSTVRFVIESQPRYPGLHGPVEPRPLPEGKGPATGATGETGPTQEDEEPGWLPRASLLDLETSERTTTPLVRCDDVSFPEEFSGLGLLSVLTVDLEEGLVPTDVDTVITDGNTVYASATGLYVATSTLAPPRGEVAGVPERIIAPETTTIPTTLSGDTAIHRFDTGSRSATEYAASGEVRGTLIGQFAMSEVEGVLRVASTKGDPWAEGPSESESMITALAESGESLEEIGRVGGLGRGEEIYAVRFIGDTGYVVTFEQTDPLYTVDLSIPEDPEVTGELKMPGYSAYLHPVADGRLLGIGQAGTADGTITGAQASLFDVADPEQPQRLAALDLSTGRYGTSSTEWDHHAFLYSPEHELAVVPVQSYGRERFRGAVAVRVDAGGGLSEAARIEDPGQIERTLIVGENLVTVSTRGVSVRPVGDL